jgi:hypothetical protein
MAKKKAKVAKKAAKKVATRAARPSSQCSDEELRESRVVTAGGEATVDLVGYIGSDTAAFIAPFPVMMQEVTVIPAENEARALTWLREEIETNDYDETPYLRVVGRVVHVLTVRRRKVTCSGGDVFRVFLGEIPQHSPYAPAEYRLQRPTKRGNVFDITQEPGRTKIKDRLSDLKNKKYAQTAKATRVGDGRGYMLTQRGLVVFDGWPEVEGLELDPPLNTSGNGAASG